MNSLVYFGAAPDHITTRRSQLGEKLGQGSTLWSTSSPDNGFLYWLCLSSLDDTDICLMRQSPLNGKLAMNGASWLLNHLSILAYAVRFFFVCEGAPAKQITLVDLWRMNGTIAIKPLSLYSLQFSLTLAWDELDSHGRRLEWVEPWINLPSYPLSQQTPEDCHGFEITWHIGYDSPSRNREFNRSQDIHTLLWCGEFKMRLRSMESWKMFARKTSLLVPDNSLLSFKNSTRIGIRWIPLDK